MVSTYLLSFLWILIVWTYITCTVAAAASDDVNDDDDAFITRRPKMMKSYILFEMYWPTDIAYVYKTVPAQDFGGKFQQFHEKTSLVLSQPSKACSPILNDIVDRVAFVERGECSFITKAFYVEQAGGLAIIISDVLMKNSADAVFIDMIDAGDVDDGPITIPALYLLGNDGYRIKSTLESVRTTTSPISIPFNETEIEAGFKKMHKTYTPWTRW